MTSVPADKQQASAEPSPPTVVVSGDGDRLALAGALEIGTLAEARNSLQKWSKQGSSRSLDIAKLDSLDTPGALFLCGLRDKGVKLTGVRAEHRALLDLIGGLDLKPLPKIESVPRWRQIVIQLGKGAHDARHDALDIITFVGRAASWTGQRPDAPGLPAPGFDLAAHSGNRHSCAAHHRPDGRHDRDRHRLPGRCPAAPLWRRGLHHQPGGGVGIARNGRADHRHHGGRPLGLRIHRRNRRHEDAGGSRRAQSDGDRAHAGAGGAAGDRSGHHPAAAHVLRRHDGPDRRRRDFPIAA